MSLRTTSRSLLIEMLHEAAELEHSLLCSYLYAASSIKATPQEWANAGDLPNRRRAQQFERARLWKAGILQVAHEEMRHLHYVQCLIRALGERPYLGLPQRNAARQWKIGNWAARIGDRPPSRDGTEVPVEPLSIDTIRKFILFESTDALQDQDPFGQRSLDLYERLYDFEFALRIEGMLVGMAEGEQKQTLKARLHHLYRELPPLDAQPQVALALVAEPERVRPLEQIRFQSIADLYRDGILPLYEQAFESGWVVANDRNLLDEQLNPDYAAEGFLPVGPIGRSQRFARFAQGNQQDPLRDYRRVEDIVREIVEEGEGATLFCQRSESMLAKVNEIGVAGFLAALARDAQGGPGYATPDWLAEAQLVRKSHLFAFAMIFIEMKQETALARQVGVAFEPARTPVAASTPELRKLKAELPQQFNAAYLGMLAWLARMYETREWAADKPRRMAIEMLATWPLMSLAIRPMLELAGLVGSDSTALFRYSDQDVPLLPVWAQELAALYESPDRSETINARMDTLIVRTLRAVANWAEQLAATMASDMPPAPGGELILVRLQALTRLSEFERQFPYRTAGGYSDRQPDLTYINTHPHADDVSEAPLLPPAEADKPLFADTLVARVRFRGWGLVQLATDPDPPTDEVGVTGTHMLHPADGDRRFDRALVWQDYEPELNIHRPAPDAPPLGIDCCEVALLAADRLTGARAGYVPLGVMNSAGAVQTTGVQQVLSVTGFYPVSSLTEETLPAALRPLAVFLESKQGVRPFLNGENHLVWQDGEPIDPFILSIYAGDGTNRQRLLSREVFNRGGLSVERMEPYQRLLTARGPCGFDGVGNVPAWAKTPEVEAILSAPGFPRSFLQHRAAGLIEALIAATGEDAWTQERVDTAISYAERLARVAQPRSTTVGWLTALLHYGHTVSGAQSALSARPLLDALGNACGLQLEVAAAAADRDTPNSRWLAKYTKGMMDTDTLSDFVYGELYVPLRVVGGQPRFSRSWSFPAGMQNAVRWYALDFAKPFWATFDVSGGIRTTQVIGLDPAHPEHAVTLTETLTEAGEDGYTYVVAPLAGVSQTGAFSLRPDGDNITLQWACTFTADTPAHLVQWMAMLAQVAATMESRLAAHFAPK